MPSVSDGFRREHGRCTGCAIPELALRLATLIK